MRKAVGDYTALLQVASLQATSTQLAQKKVRPLRYPSPVGICRHSTGWTPSTFVSSRSDRAKQKASRPEDYMDEEDLAELRESQIMTGVKEQQQRDTLGGTQTEPTPADPEQE
jgi:Protein of unknown function (DUF1604)